MIMPPILTTSLIHLVSLKGWENVLLELGFDKQTQRLLNRGYPRDLVYLDQNQRFWAVPSELANTQ